MTTEDFDALLDAAHKAQVCAECGDDLYFGNSPRGSRFCSRPCGSRFRARRRRQEARAAKERRKREEPPTS